MGSSCMFVSVGVVQVCFLVNVEIIMHKNVLLLFNHNVC